MWKTLLSLAVLALLVYAAEVQAQAGALTYMSASLIAGIVWVNASKEFSARNPIVKILPLSMTPVIFLGLPIGILSEDSRFSDSQILEQLGLLVLLAMVIVPAIAVLPVAAPIRTRFTRWEEKIANSRHTEVVVGLLEALWALLEALFNMAAEFLAATIWLLTVLALAIWVLKSI
jgi:hypothetical protein